MLDRRGMEVIASQAKIEPLRRPLLRIMAENPMSRPLRMVRTEALVASATSLAVSSFLAKM